METTQANKGKGLLRIVILNAKPKLVEILKKHNITAFDKNDNQAIYVATISAMMASDKIKDEVVLLIKNCVKSKASKKAGWLSESDWGLNNKAIDNNVKNFGGQSDEKSGWSASDVGGVTDSVTSLLAMIASLKQNSQNTGHDNSAQLAALQQQLATLQAMKNKSKGLSTGAIIGIVGGSVAVLGLIVFLSIKN